MWQATKLRELAASDERSFRSARLDDLYLAMCRHRGNLIEPPVPKAQALQQLNAALDAVALADIRRDRTPDEPPNSIYEQMLELKRKRLTELAQTKSQHRTPDTEPDDGTEPTQAG